MLSKEQIEQTLKNRYSREQWKAMLTSLFAQHDEEVKWERQPAEIPLGNKTAAYWAKNCFHLGTVLLTDGKIIKVYEAEILNTRIAQNRVGLRSLIQSEIIPGFNDAALAVFHSNEQTEWRFTFMSKWEYPEESGKVVKHETHPKKFTYVLGPAESSRTARDRFYELQIKPNTLQSVVDAFSVAKMSREFFEAYREDYNAFYDYLKNSSYRKSVFNIPKHRDVIENEKAEKPIRDFVKRLLGRIVFLYFLQKKGWMQSIWAEPGEIKPDAAFMTHLFQFAERKEDFYSTYLLPLFFQTLNNSERGDDVFKIEGTVLGKIPYLNGGLFEKDFKGVEDIRFKNSLFQNLFNFFDSYNFTIIEDSPEEREVAVDPEMLGHIFENLIEENKKFGTFYTPKEVVHFMTQEALLLHLAKKLSLDAGTTEWKSLKTFVRYKEHDAFIRSVALKINSHLDDVKVCDPAIGSGAFPVGILLEIFQMKSFLNSILQLGDFNYAEVKEKIIRNSIYGVDIDKGAIDIARLRFWLSLIVDLDKPRPLPNFDYKFMQGNSLKEEFEGIPLKIKEEKRKAQNVDLFGEASEPESFYGFLNKSDINLEKLEEDLFDAHDDKIKKEMRKKLNSTEKAYIKYCIYDKLTEIKTRIDNEWGNYGRKAAGLTPTQKETIKASYQKKIHKLEAEKDQFESKAQLLKELDVYEKPYFLWHLYFKHVFDNGGFDIVIANPPYGVKADDELYVNSGLGSKDSYGFFIKLAIDTLLTINGTLVYIVSDTWLTIKSHLELRKWILKNQLHKVIRLHADTFGAVVNTCIFSLTRTDSAIAESEVIAADLTSLSTRKSLPEFREKLLHLEEFTGEFNERYAVYRYPQRLINTNSNLPVFTASPKLFALMNDSICENEKHIIQDNEEEIAIEMRKIKLNNIEVELIRFGDIAEVNQGISTGQNEYYIKRIAMGEGYLAVNMELVLTQKEIENLDSDEKLNGISPDKYLGKYFIPYDKGGESDTEEGWLPNYYVPGKYFIDWSKNSLKRMRTLSIARRKIQDNKKTAINKDDYKKIAAALRNQDKWFKTTINFSPTGLYSPTFRLGFGTIAQNTSSSIIVSNEFKFFTLGILCSRLARFLFKNFLNHTIHTQEGDVMDFSFPINKSLDIEDIVNGLIEKQKKNYLYDYHSNEQKEIDRLVYKLYGLNDEDIQEVEYWWARRYPKLARFADTRLRLSVKDKQEQLARLQETITRGENKYCEFKSSLRLDIKKGTPEKYIEHSAFKNIAAFLNSEGGTLIIGVDDDKNILGLEQTDYTTFSQSGKLDEWSKHLDNLIQNYLGNKVHSFLKTQHITIDGKTDGKTVAVIEVKPSPKEVWLKNGNNEEFYIRRTASATQLTGSDAVDYIKAHWSK